ncbi:CPBP family intramembrane glutamic endopeptidase [Sinomicrobium weinanense]|uniref:CPBP family intramembrane metalloprotease n=1 Tax=Sinomicrobium weinanense TaxID=2842200 RepID=A0A926Q4U5_9FLAO|nr:CPBP family intramembrane glutamic endopeptidase [Sinomicrobium weinanense]MBC9797260.1 CPBP family intramembrane metalloprotease [Sinomicrobium weinanense]MBU3122338.1 CPBP family intramembrane metalloprotease [Sinomicrobium weinanense]
MFIEQAFKGKNHNWFYYVAGVVLAFTGWQFIGAVPLIAVLFLKVPDMMSFPSDIGGMTDLLGANLFLFLMIISFLTGLLALLFTVKYIHKQPLLALTTSRKRIDKKRILYGFGLVVAINSILFVIGYFLSPGDFQWNFKPLPFLILLAITIIMLPIQTSFEEYLFRGYLMQGLGVLAKNRWFPLITTSVFFGLLHIFNPEVKELGYIIMVYYIGTGLLLGVMTLMDDGMELALGYHAGNNMLTALLVTADWTALQTDSLFLDISSPEAGFDVLAPVLIYPVVIYILARKYGWTGWKEKLFGKVEPPLPAEAETEYLK